MDDKYNYSSLKSLCEGMLSGSQVTVETTLHPTQVKALLKELASETGKSYTFNRHNTSVTITCQGGGDADDEHWPRKS